MSDAEVSNEILDEILSDMVDKKGLRLRIENKKLFDKYLLAYDALPSYKKVLSSTIKFKDMYQPLRKRSGYPVLFNDIKGLNAERKFQRAQIALNRRDLINTFDDVHGKRLVVTSRGHKIFYKDYPLAKLRDKPWDGVWTVIMYDFPERDRAQRRWIRRRLMRLGFGCPQISILISPLPIEEPVQKLLEGEEMAEQVWTLRAERILGMDNRQVARKAWPIVEELNQLYRELLSVLPNIEKDKELLDEWKAYFLAVNDADPYLPLDLLPEDWRGGKCEEEFVKLGPGGLFKILLRKLK